MSKLFLGVQIGLACLMVAGHVDAGHRAKIKHTKAAVKVVTKTRSAGTNLCKCGPACQCGANCQCGTACGCR